MKKESGILKLMNIRREEAKAVFLLIAFSFLIGLTLSFYFTASNAIFLKHFKPSMIPVSFIASGILIYLAWWIFSKSDRRFSFSTQVLLKLGFIFLTVLAISIGVYLYNNSWLIFIMYTWVRIVVYITLVTFWSIAGKIFNIRQGKRIFGLIGTGEVVSVMIGYFSIPLILNFLKASHLLFLASGTLLFCLIIATILLRSFKEELSEPKMKEEKGTEKKKPETSYWKLVKEPYFMLISLLALLPIFGYLFVDFLFLAQTKLEFANNPETIAGFFGIFLGFVSVIELLLKLFSGRFLNKYGIKPSLISLPVILLVPVFIAAIFGSLYGAAGLFFAFIAMARLFERSVRSAVYEPAFQLLYQPVPPGQRIIFQNQIEGIPKAIGTIITGLVILLFSTLEFFNMVHYNWFFILVLALWIWVAIKMYETYRNLLKSKLNDLKSEKEKASSSVSEVIRQKLRQAGRNNFGHIFKICMTAQPFLTEKILEEIFEEVPEEIKRIILEKMAEYQMVNSAGFLKSLDPIKQQTHLQSMLDKTVEYLESTANTPIEEIANLCKSPERGDRLKAARLLGSSGRYNTIRLLHSLTKDTDAEVKKAVIVACGKIRRYELWAFVCEQLAYDTFAETAGIAVKQIGEPILPELERIFEKSKGHSIVQVRILKIYESIQSQKSLRLLRDKMRHPDKDVRRQVLVSLSNRKYQATASETPLLKEMIEETVSGILWVLATLQDISGCEEAADLKLALLTEEEDQKEFLFLLLSLMYDEKTIHHIREHIESKDANAKVYALEIGDMIIGDEIKEIFFPIFEDLPVQERLNRFIFRFPQQKLEPFERFCEILNRPYTRSSRYSKACALKILETRKGNNEQATERILAANVVHPDRLISEIAALTLYRFNIKYYRDLINRLKKNGYIGSGAMEEGIRSCEEESELLMFEKTGLMRSTELFSTIPETAIIDFLERTPEASFIRQPAASPGYFPQDTSLEYLSTDLGYYVALPKATLYEFMMSSPELAEKLFNIIRINNSN